MEKNYSSSVINDLKVIFGEQPTVCPNLTETKIERQQFVDKRFAHKQSKVVKNVQYHRTTGGKQHSDREENER